MAVLAFKAGQCFSYHVPACWNIPGTTAQSPAPPLQEGEHHAKEKAGFSELINKSFNEKGKIN